MAQVGNNDNRFGGEYMIQDRDHMSGISTGSDSAQGGDVRQFEQSQENGRQQGGDDQDASAQQGREQRRQARLDLL